MKIFGEQYEWPEVGIFYVWCFGAALNFFSGEVGGFLVGGMMLAFVIEQHLGVTWKNSSKQWRDLSEKQQKLCEAQQAELQALLSTLTKLSEEASRK